MIYKLKPHSCKVNKPLPIRILLFCCCFGVALAALAQSSPPPRSGSLQINSYIIKLDTLPIVPNSLSISGIDADDYELDFLNATLRILDSSVIDRNIQYKYNCFSFNPLDTVQHRSTSLNVRQRGSMYHQLSPIVPKTEDVFANDNSSLIGTGSIARGMSIGTNQDFVLNSSLNLQLTGKLSEKWEIMANITDKNVPIQPEGNTQSIQDFDQVYIRLDYDHRFKIDAGDIEMSQKDDAFMRVSRKFMGMVFSADNSFKGNNNLKNVVGGGLSKGKFVKKYITAINGVQGPYRLTGEQDESNIVVLAGSERVYINGQLLVRGQENDYTIDYNTGEITFTVKQLITSDLRIIVEYEYSDKHYSRFNLFTFNEFTHEKNGKLKLKVNYFHEQDLKNHSIQPELDNDQKAFLSTISDDASLAWYPNIDSVMYNANEVLYERRDTVVDGQAYIFYVHSNNNQVQLYRLGFTLVGENMGNYVLESSTANGRVFRWLAPVNGEPQGNYEPVQQLYTPKSIDMATVAAAYDFSKNTGISTELALSSYDGNSFSKDYKNKVGFAYNLDFHHFKEMKKQKNDTIPWFFNTQLHYEFLHKDFRILESSREVEFRRNYSVDEEYSNDYHEQMLRFGLGFSHLQIGEINYFLNWFARFGNMNALKNELQINTLKNGWLFKTNTSYLFSNDTIQNTNHILSSSTFSKIMKKVEIGVNESFEYKMMKENGTDSTRLGSKATNQAQLFLKNNDSTAYQYEISYLNRLESQLKNNALILGTISNEAKASFALTKVKNNRLKVNATYRNIQQKNDEGRFQGENCFLAGVEYTGRFWRNALVLNTYYEAGSGLEQKMVYSFLKVADGQGVYVWNDYNGNGIEELDEFEVAAFQDQANYIKVWQTGNEYVNTFNNQFLQTIQLRPANVWSNKKDFRRVLARFSNTTTFKTVQKNTLDNANAFNPFYLNMNDTNVVSSNLSFINTLTYNHKSFFGIDFIVQANKNKSLLYYGSDKGSYDLQQVVLRGNPCSVLTLKTDYRHSFKRNDSQYMDSRSYNIEEHQSLTEVDFHWKNSLFVILAYDFFAKKNYGGGQQAQQHKVNLNIKYKILKKGNLTGEVAYILLKSDVENNSSLAYEMLEGLSVGNNMTWAVKYEAGIGDFLRVNLLYQGRYTQGNKVVHTGSLELRASF